MTALAHAAYQLAYGRPRDLRPHQVHPVAVGHRQGGFSSRNLSVGAYDSAYFDVVIGIFMLLFGVNFNLYYFLLIRRFGEVFRSEELKAYLLIVAASVAR
mgnify:CR=1 FL=1